MSKIDEGGYVSGCSLRDHFAGLAMQGLLASAPLNDAIVIRGSHILEREDAAKAIARLAYLQADAMIAEKRRTEGSDAVS
jgi:hypothetical protein